MRVAVIGAGLAGSVAAMELSSAGVDVVLFESATEPMSGASRYNEGKVHLGYVYAKDPTGRTVTLMQQGALSFAPILRRYLGDAVDSIPVSAPFDYVVHPESQMTQPELAMRYAGIAAELAVQRQAHAPDSYLGMRGTSAPRWRTTEEAAKIGLAGEGAHSIFATDERAVEPFALADAVGRAIRRAPIDLRCDVVVERVEVGSAGYWLATNQGRIGPFESVINASWGSRHMLDRSAGIIARGTWNYRFKYFLRVQKDGVGRTLPDVTWAVGPFGDVVTYGDNTAYLSWYPAGRIGWSTTCHPPAWTPSPVAQVSGHVKEGILSGLARLLPVIRSINPKVDDIQVWGGLIIGNGETDIHDPASGLHRRDDIGVTSVGAYHSVSTGKLTTAPLLGERAARAVLTGST